MKEYPIFKKLDDSIEFFKAEYLTLKPLPGYENDDN
jgi:hypothetical protein